MLNIAAQLWPSSDSWTLLHEERRVKTGSERNLPHHPSYWLGTRCSWAARSLDDLYFIGQNWFGLSCPRKHLFMSRTHGVWLKTPNTKTTFVIYVKFDTRIIHWLHLLILKFKTYIRCCSRNGQRCLLEVGSW